MPNREGKRREEKRREDSTEILSYITAVSTALTFEDTKASSYKIEDEDFRASNTDTVVRPEMKSASGTRGMREQPLINTSNMKSVVALWKKSDFLAVTEIHQANRTT